MIMKRSKIILLLLLPVWISGISQTIHVSVTGDDNNPGTEALPLASVSAANEKVKGLRLNGLVNDTIFVRIKSGTYFITEPVEFNPEHSGTKEFPVVFIGDSEDRPVICGGMALDPFEVVYPGLWRVYVPQVVESGLYFEQLYINDERRFRARTPNKGEFYKVERASESVFGRHEVFVRDENREWLSEIDGEDINDVLVGFYHNWDYTPKRILNVNPIDMSFHISDAGVWPWNPLTSESRYFIENYPKALDAPGEWCLSRDGYLYYIPMEGETPENVTAVVPVTEQFMRIAGSEEERVAHISFQNLCFEVAAYNTPAGGEILGQASALIDASIMIDYADNIDFINCDVTRTGLHAIWYRWKCSQSKVERCHLYDLGGGGVKIGTDHYASDNNVTNNITVHNNIIQHGGYVFPSAVGVIIFQASDNVLSHNDIADFRYSGISVGWTWGYGNSASKRNIVAYNHIHYIGWCELSDMGGVYTLGVSEGTVVSNNVIHHVYSYGYGGWGLYTDEGSSYILMENNLVYKCKSAGFHQHYGKENVIRNNIFALNHLSQLQQSRAEDHTELLFTNNIVYSNEGSLLMYQENNAWLNVIADIDYNCYWNTRMEYPDFHGLTFDEWKNIGRDAHSVVSDPMFVDPEKYDFRFRDFSSADKINFKPFDYSVAGVYGGADWLAKAELPDGLQEEFERTLLFTSPYKLTLSIAGDTSCIKPALLPGIHRVYGERDVSFSVSLLDGYRTSDIYVIFNDKEIEPLKIETHTWGKEYFFNTGIITKYSEITVFGMEEDVATGKIPCNATKVYVSGESLIVEMSADEAAHDISVYTVSGKLFYKKNTTETRAVITLPKGLYIVKVNNGTIKKVAL